MGWSSVESRTVSEVVIIVTAPRDCECTDKSKKFLGGEGCWYIGSFTPDGLSLIL